jgi:HEAT repeat protein
LALPALARAFPGRASSVSSALVGRPVPLAQLPPPRPSSVPGVLVTLGADAAAAIVVGALDQSARELRFAAVHLLAHVDVPAALPRLAVRVFDHEPRIARLALEVLSRRRTTPGFTDVLARLRELARRGDGDDRLPAIAALAALRDPQAVGILVDLLSTRPTQIAEAAHDALVRITRADFGFAERRWRAWASVHADEPRRRWLLRALRHVDVSLRRAAAADLVDDGVPLFGYDADADVLDRDISVDAIARNLGEPVP